MINLILVQYYSSWSTSFLILKIYLNNSKIIDLFDFYIYISLSYSDKMFDIVTIEGIYNF